MDTIEIEVKFLSPDTEALRRSVLALGGESLGRHFEHNTRYDDAQHTLLSSKHLLRLRRTHENVLTYKMPPDQTGLEEFKAYREMEVVVDDYEAMDGIIKTLGYEPHQVYEKWRETFKLADAEIVMDAMPFGDFIEIEGAAEVVRRTADQLHLNWDDRILYTYLEIFALMQRHLALPFNDVTFDNFGRYPVDIGLFFDDLRAAP